MNKYFFKAITLNNQKISGVVEANNDIELRKIITYHQYYLIKYKLLKEHQNDFIPKVVRKKDIVLFCKNMAMMLKSHMNLTIIIRLMKTNVKNKLLQNILNETEEEMLKGKTLSACMEKYPKCFPKMMISMVKIAEISNTLPDTFEHLTRFYEEEQSLKTKIVNALFYPTLLLGLTIIVVFILSTVVLPMYGEIFSSNQLSLPLITKLLLGISDFFKSNLYYILGGFIVLGGLIFLLLKCKMGKRIISNYLVNGMVIKDLMKQFYTYQVASSLSLLINSGMSFTDTFKHLLDVIDNEYLKRKFLFITDEIKRGQSLGKAMEAGNYFPDMLIEMIKMGEKAGNVCFGLNQCSSYFFDKLKNTLSKISVLVEPIMIIIISLFVGGIMVSVFMPMMEVMSSLR